MALRILLFALLVAVVLLLFYFRLTRYARWKRRVLAEPFPEQWREILQKRVSFYRKLSDEEKARFEKRVQLFLARTNVIGLKMEINDTVRVLVAASAIIPVFGFDEWEYDNLAEVLVVPGSIQPENEGEDYGVGTVLGQARQFQNQYYVKISKPVLEAGFKSDDQKNVGIHEFAHLIDQADGDVDGVPESLLPPELLRSWSKLMHKAMAEIKRNRSDIDAYGATSEQEFFAVVTEYFFEKPQQLAEHHPELYQLLTKVFHQNPKQRFSRKVGGMLGHRR
ncbi:hypothetical protein SAMN05421823_10887 [Catalinimonas alkaloidigena]|uniref:Peptidase n=1 Tax=Catalinimonas alkaloidigena TaxID=1075417 RepID=A0A1G9MUB3_9BACT|nr:M90 family metallopeptidase [Catalinimonas alkaloidigena]SDL77713.1 hypothetical protein SAMN05421823_10887 [Catalinimonas alkaloidigena]